MPVDIWRCESGNYRVTAGLRRAAIIANDRADVSRKSAYRKPFTRPLYVPMLALVPLPYNLLRCISYADDTNACTLLSARATKQFSLCRITTIPDRNVHGAFHYFRGNHFDRFSFVDSEITDRKT